MRTAVIKHRVADFLRQHAPFDCMELEDLLTLADTGRVSFHQANEAICRAGDPRKPFLYVVQQGRVDLYEGGSDRLRDILTAGDTIGFEHFLPGDSYLDTARTAGDVILYGLDSATFEQIASRYPQTSRFLAAHFSARRAGAANGGDTEQPVAVSWTSRVLPLASIAEEEPLFVKHDAPIPEVMRALTDSGASFAVGCDDAGNVRGTATLADCALALGDPASLIWKPVARGMREDSAGDLFLRLIRSGATTITLETEGGAKAVVTEESLANAAHCNPASGIRAIRLARSRERLNFLRASTDALAASALTGPDSIEWAGRYTAERNRAMIERLLDSKGCSVLLFGADARLETTGSTMPLVGLGGPLRAERETLADAMQSSGYAAPAEPRGDSGEARSLEEWEGFYRKLIQDPIGNDVYLARHYLDLNLATGDAGFLMELRSLMLDQLQQNPAFVAIVANDALGRLPPLTFYQNVVVDIEGGSSPELDLAKVAVTPIVDAARALALSALDLDHVSTIERLRASAEAFPETRARCLDAIDAYRVVAYQAAVRTIGHGDAQALQPAALGKYERELLKSAFRAIAALLEFVTVHAGFGAS